MIEIKQSIAKEIADIISKEYPDAKISCDDIVAIFEYPPDPAMGDLAVPCFKFSKTLRRSPIQIAESIKNGLNSVDKLSLIHIYKNARRVRHDTCGRLCARRDLKLQKSICNRPPVFYFEG